MPAARVTFADKATLQKLYHNEVNALKAAINTNADLLDTTQQTLASKLDLSQLNTILNGLRSYFLLTLTQMRSYASDGMPPFRLFRITGRAGDDVLVFSIGPHGLAGDLAYTTPAGTDDGPYAPVTYDLTTDTTAPRTAYDDTAVRNLIGLLQTGKLEVWQPGAQFANRVYFVPSGVGVGPGLFQPKQDWSNSQSVSLSNYNRVADFRFLPAQDVEAMVTSLTTRVVALENTAPAGFSFQVSLWNAQANTLPTGYALAETPLPAKGRFYLVSTTTAPVTAATTQATNGDTYIYLSSVAGIGPGHAVTGPGVPAGTRVTQAYGGGAVELNKLVTLAGGVTLTFTPQFAGIQQFWAGDELYSDGQAWRVRLGRAGVLAQAGSSFTANQAAAITSANAPSAANKFATFNDLPSPNGTPAAPFGFVGFTAPRQMLWLRGYPGQVNSGYEASGGTSVARNNVINPNNWPGLYSVNVTATDFIRSPRLWCKRIEFYTSWDGPGYDQRFRIRVFNGADDAVLVDKVVAIDQSARYYNYGGGWEWYRVGGGDGNTPSWVEILPAYTDCYVIINYVAGGQFIQSGIDIY